MPFIEGESLRERLRREHQLPVDDTLHIARDIAGALQYAHRAGFVHRDIKPENILLSGDPALFADFGVARSMAAITPPASFAAQWRDAHAHGIHGRHARLHEPRAGERGTQARRPRRPYSLAEVAYEMLAGEPPFVAARRRL